MHLVQPLADPRTYVRGALGRALPRDPEDDGEGARRALPGRRHARPRPVPPADRRSAGGRRARRHGGRDASRATNAPARAAAAAYASSHAPSHAPTHTPPHPAFDSGVLNRVEELLAGAVGPMARVLVRRAAKTAPSLEALCSDLAEQVEAGHAREAFRSKCLVAGRSAVPPPAPAPPSSPSHGPAAARATPAPAHATPGRSVSGTSPAASLGGAGNTLAITEADLHVLDVELARHVGPLARRPRQEGREERGLPRPARRGPRGRDPVRRRAARVPVGGPQAPVALT